MMYRTSPLLAGLLATSLVLGACADVGPVAPLAPTEATLASSSAPNLLSCPSTEAVTVTDTIGILGGTLRVVDTAGGEHTIDFPLNSLSLPTIFTVTLPASDHLKARVTATVLGATVPLSSLSFPALLRPTVSISLARCGDVPSGSLYLYNTDETTGEVLEGPFGNRAGGANGNRVSGKVPHFSDYSIGAP